MGLGSTTETEPHGLTARTFVDTNVFVYAVDRDEPSKQARAIEVLAGLAGKLTTSAQVLAEFYVTVTRKLATPLSAEDAARQASRLAELDVVPIDGPLVLAATKLSREATLSYWDAAIVEAAARSKCPRLLSEDLQHGALINGVRVENPFTS